MRLAVDGRLTFPTKQFVRPIDSLRSMQVKSSDRTQLDTPALACRHQLYKLKLAEVFGGKVDLRSYNASSVLKENAFFGLKCTALSSFRFTVGSSGH